MFVRILNSEMELATGCTEPGAVALTAAEAGAALRKAGGTRVEAVTVRASINIIKNAMSAGIPGTSYQGMDYAAAIGAVGGDPVHLLEVMNYVPREQMEEAAALVGAGKVKVEVAQVPQKLYIEVLVTSDGHTGRAVVRDLHTNVVLVEQDGVATLDKQHTDSAAAGDSDVVTPEQIAEFLTVRSIWDYCTEELDPLHDPIDIIRSAVQVNTTISDEGLSKEYGLAIGRNLELNCRKGLMTRDLTTNAMVAASAGADARMAGAPVSVVANSGSGNQGITATMPVVATARWLDIDEEKMLRAVTLSNLIAIRIKAKFGRLSNLCGATVAATGAACGIAYLLGGGYHEVCCTIQNMVGNVTGMVCDGAKADCALKISTCVNAACQAAAMGVRGVRVQSTDGIVEHNVEYTLDNFATPFGERPGCYGKLLFSMHYFYNELYLLALSHDEVVHGKKTIIDKLWGSYAEKCAQLRTLYFYMYTHPGKKLNFMGNELAHFREWDEKRELDWNLLEYPFHDAFQKYFAALCRTYASEPALYDGEYNPDCFEWVASESCAEGVYAWLRKGRGQNLLCVMNTQDSAHKKFPLYLKFPCSAELVLDTEAGTWGGVHKAHRKQNFHTTDGGVFGRDYTLTLDLPAMGSYLLRLTPEAPNPDAARLSANKALAQKRKAAKAAKAAAEVSDK